VDEGIREIDRALVVIRDQHRGVSRRVPRRGLESDTREDLTVIVDEIEQLGMVDGRQNHPGHLAHHLHHRSGRIRGPESELVPPHDDACVPEGGNRGRSAEPHEAPDVVRVSVGHQDDVDVVGADPQALERTGELARRAVRSAEVPQARVHQGEAFAGPQQERLVGEPDHGFLGQRRAREPPPPLLRHAGEDRLRRVIAPPVGKDRALDRADQEAVLRVHGLPPSTGALMDQPANLCP